MLRFSDHMACLLWTRLHETERYACSHMDLVVHRDERFHVASRQQGRGLELDVCIHLFIMGSTLMFLQFAWWWTYVCGWSFIPLV